ncbi:hypothetical protein BGZ61DRAFT_30334 [Ilyonectria robusta]|uniref:uncharacterized protein n=1 Tax=Ilyonectria robusta TaxID=1079257 RepID=UPI001E8D2B0A|nr:uncharacterized protein BGZ61DRAFT_30334 [Ilyonectria robusta]KAH8738293.1 hypothetical protein BGZ61DRAFT_30334 [Ilyonectria robusta]
MHESPTCDLRRYVLRADIDTARGWLPRAPSAHPDKARHRLTHSDARTAPVRGGPQARLGLKWMDATVTVTCRLAETLEPGSIPFMHPRGKNLVHSPVVNITRAGVHALIHTTDLTQPGMDGYADIANQRATPGRPKRVPCRASTSIIINHDIQFVILL